MKFKINNWVKISFSLIVLIVVIANVGLENLLESLRGIDLRWFLVALVLQLIGLAIRAYRWWLLVASLGTPVSFGRLLYLYFAGNFFNTFLPTGIGGDVVRIYELSGERGGANAFSTVLADRMTGVLGSSLVALAVATFGGAVVPQATMTTVIFVSTSILVVALLFTQGSLLERIVGRTRIFAALMRRTRIRNLYTALTSYSIRSIALSTLVSLPFTATLIATQYALSHALGLNIDIRYFMLFTPIVALVQLLPISLSGLGVREGTFQVLFTSVGVEAHDAVALSLLFYVVRVVTGLFGGIIYFIGNLRRQPTPAPGPPHSHTDLPIHPEGNTPS
jgi:uncharacterized protein (TIRG00374 family)